MRISTKGRYALRLMLDLAVNGKDNYISIKNISTRQEITDKYLEQIINQLCKAGFVKSARGANGGYRLSREPKDYTVGMILNVMEGTLSPVPCLDYETNTCPRSNACITLDVWRQIHEAVQNVVDNITLADLVEKYHAEYGDEEIAPCYDQDMKKMLS
mgnify:FL=1